MGLWNVQSVLNRGELDPLTLGRIDLQQYYNGVSLAQNVLAIPQGGLKKRPGMEYIDTVLTGVSSGSYGRLEAFSVSVDNNYLLVFSPSEMRIYKNGVRQTNINGSGLDYITTPWFASPFIRDMDFIQSADTAVVTHPSIAPYLIQRTSDTAWTISLAPLTNLPQYNYDDALSPTPTSQIQQLTFTNASDGDRFKLALNGILTDEIVYSTTASGISTLASSIAEELLALPNTPNSGITANSPVAGTVDITFADGAADDWDEITGTPILTEALTFQVVSSITQAGVPKTEDAWSATRGWPTTCTFHEGRLWFGGSKSLKQALWGSVVNDFFNFKTRKGLDDEAVTAVLDTDKLNAIQGIFSNRSLQVFTAGGEFVVPSSPITPENIAVVPQSGLGSKRVRPITIDGVTVFIQRTGKAILQTVFVDDFKSNQTASISILAPHLIKNPVQLYASRGTESTDANYVYIVNDDGTVTVFNTLAAQEVAGFTRWETDGLIKSVAVVDNTVYFFTVRRDSVGTYSTVIEVENNSLNTDYSTITAGTGLTTITGLSHLESETVKVKADGAVRSDAVVSSGQITISPAADTVEVGLEYLPIITTMPLNVNLQNGPNIAKKKKIMRASVQLHESNGIIIGGQRLADKTIGLNQFDAPEPFTGLKRIHLSGWSLEADLTITQDTPMDMTILNIGLEVKV